MASRHRSVRIDDEVWDEIDARPGKTLNDKLRGMLSEGQAEQPKARAPSADLAAGVSETLELVRSLPDAETIQSIVEDALQRKIDERAAARPAPQAFNPASIPGVYQGTQGLPRRESGNERAAREEREREARARARSTLGDSPDFCVDPQYVQE